MSKAGEVDIHNKPTTRPAHDEAPTIPSLPGMDGDTLPVGRVFGEYELEEELGRGGMGVVYRARQKGLNRRVALKMILPGPLANPEDLKRFRMEAESAGKLQHPNIVNVHEVGEIDGIHFYSMDFIEGESLSEILAKGPLHCRRAARYVMTIAKAMDHAHNLGILHRDLKPSNILLDKSGDPRVTDFGLAKIIGGDPGQTRTGSVMGTPNYMSPEQASGRIKDLGPATDIYSLGAVLYELMTGQPLFEASSAVEALKFVIEREPVPPRQVNPKIDRDLEIICLKCLEKDPKRRYSSALDLALDLERYLAGEAIRARSRTWFDGMTRALTRSQHAVEFRDWETMLLLFAAIMFLGHLVVFLLAQWEKPIVWHWFARGTQFTLMGLLFWRYRTRTMLPTTAAERQLWSIWIAYLLSYLVAVVVNRSMFTAEHWDDLTLYPFTAVLTGMAFFVMGSSYWGYCYLLGLGFLVLALAMPLCLPLAPLGMGVMWSVTLFSLGFHIRKTESR